MPYPFTIQTLEEGWQDRDFILLHACFQCLADCVEQEKLLDNQRDWKHSDTIQAAHQELIIRYNWWKTRTDASATPSSGIVNKADYEADTEMLTRLIKLRSYL